MVYLAQEQIGERSEGKWSQHYRVLLVDLRNHGRSPHAERMDYPLMAADVAATIQRLGAEPCTVIGHSMGGKAAMWLAMTRPELVAKLCVADIAPIVSGQDHLPILNAMSELPMSRLSSRREADEALSKSIPDPALRQFLLQNVSTTASGLSWRINLPAITNSMNDLHSFPDDPSGQPYNGTTLFVRGELSSYVPDDAQTEIRSRFPNATIQTIADAGHWLHAEQPTAFINTVNPFLGIA